MKEPSTLRLPVRRKDCETLVVGADIKAEEVLLSCTAQRVELNPRSDVRAQTWKNLTCSKSSRSGPEPLFDELRVRSAGKKYIASSEVCDGFVSIPVERVKEPLEEVGPPMVSTPCEEQEEFMRGLLPDEIMTETRCDK